MTNPFDDENGSYLVLVNGQGEHCLWPAFAEVPGGWTVAHGPAGRRDCLDHATARWSGPRPRPGRTARRPTHGEVIT